MRERLSVAMTEDTHATLQRQLTRSDGQEDLTFLQWIPSRGAQRLTAIITAAIPPEDGDRFVHGNVSFSAGYLERAASVARRAGTGLAMIHTHPAGVGWQGMSTDDAIAERRVARAAMAATALPLVGLTMTDAGSYSARAWPRVAVLQYQRQEGESVRVVGNALRTTRPVVGRLRDGALERTESVWGEVGQESISRLRVGVAGLGSVGSSVAEGLARMGVEDIVLVDRDLVELRNLDRLLNASRDDVGALKVEVARSAILSHRTALRGEVRAVNAWCDEEAGYRALLDCDVIFSCVDRPWARRVLNQLAYANLIPVIDGGILVRKRRERVVGADWHVHTSGPARRCLQCYGSFDPGAAAVDRDGLLDDPSYVKQLDPGHPLVSKDNVYPFSAQVAAMELLQLAALIVGPQHNLGDQNYHYTTGGLDVTQDRGCEEACPYHAMIAQGERSMPPLGNPRRIVPALHSPEEKVK